MMLAPHDSRHQIRLLAVPALLTLHVVACGAGSSTDSLVDAAPWTFDAAQADAAPELPWDRHDWQPIQSEGDPEGDCQSTDASCMADLAHLYFAVEQDVLYLDLRTHVPFPVEHGSFEIFLIPPDPQIVGHSLQVIARNARFWDGDCRSVTNLRKHAGCHWTTGPIPSSLHAEWLEEDRFVLQLSLGEIGFGGLQELQVGVGAAPFEVEVTAEFTDRYPDAVWVTATGIQGLQTIPLAR